MRELRPISAVIFSAVFFGGLISGYFGAAARAALRHTDGELANPSGGAVRRGAKIDTFLCKLNHFQYEIHLFSVPNQLHRREVRSGAERACELLLTPPPPVNTPFARGTPLICDS